jgi:hypothetical protein
MNDGVDRLLDAVGLKSSILLGADFSVCITLRAAEVKGKSSAYEFEEDTETFVVE